MKVLLVLLVLFTGCATCDQDCKAKWGAFAAGLKASSQNNKSVNCTSTQDYIGTIRTTCY